MRLTPEQLTAFDDDGSVFLPDCIGADEVAALLREAEAIYRSDRPTRPEWIAHRDFTPIEPVADDVLVEYARSHRLAAE
jgi:hypothetical protein